jgi:hypothetical protein
MRMHRHVAMAGAAAVLLLSPAIEAAPPADSDLKYKDWFESLRQPGTGIPCCSIADCRLTAYRMSADGYEVPLDGRWIVVPADKVLNHIPNPTGRGVVCYSPPASIFCFIRATDG